MPEQGNTVCPQPFYGGGIKSNKTDYMTLCCVTMKDKQTDRVEQLLDLLSISVMQITKSYW
jgi:hypothetical protein